MKNFLLLPLAFILIIQFDSIKSSIPVCFGEKSDDSELSDTAVSISTEKLIKCINEDQSKETGKIFFGSTLWEPLSKDAEDDREIRRHNTLLYNTLFPFPKECYSNYELKKSKYETNVKRSIILYRILLLLSYNRIAPEFIDDNGIKQADLDLNYGLGEILGRSGKIILKIHPDLDPHNLQSFILTGMMKPKFDDDNCAFKSSIADFFNIKLDQDGSMSITVPSIDDILIDLEKYFKKEGNVGKGPIDDVVLPLSYGGLGTFDHKSRMIYFNGERLESTSDKKPDAKNVGPKPKKENEKNDEVEHPKTEDSVLLTVVENMQQGVLYIDEKKFDMVHGSAMMFTLISNTFGKMDVDGESNFVEDIFFDNPSAKRVSRGISFKGYYEKVKDYTGVFNVAINVDDLDKIKLIWESIFNCNGEGKKVIAGYLIDPKHPINQVEEIDKSGSGINYPLKDHWQTMIQILKCERKSKDSTLEKKLSFASNPLVLNKHSKSIAKDHNNEESENIQFKLRARMFNNKK